MGPGRDDPKYSSPEVRDRARAHAATLRAASTLASTLLNDLGVQLKGCAATFHSLMKARIFASRPARSWKFGAAKRFR